MNSSSKNNPVFDKYAIFYDILYADKDYRAECDFVQTLLDKYAIGQVKTILDLGCGTGNHAQFLAQRGYSVTGIDLSLEMLKIARGKNIEGAEFILGDLRHLDLKRKFHAAIAMFAVVSYQITNQDLLLTFKSVARHLKKGGIFLFDFWFGPAVLTEKPSHRAKMVSTEKGALLREATPALNVLKHTVSVDYQVQEIEGEKVTREFAEKHTVRYLFSMEIEMLCFLNGFELLELCPIMKPGETPAANDWNVTAILRRK
ncbi:class I SAM-dependent methyltransferase [bacterium]|nr:class I SAM-dependent methyltransferase [bacterium]